jgi:hypothetical protein
MPHYLFKIMEGFLMLGFQRNLLLTSGFFLWVGNLVEALSALVVFFFFDTPGGVKVYTGATMRT